MSLPETVTGWIVRVKAGDPAAAQNLWENHFRRLVALARRKLRGPAAACSSGHSTGMPARAIARASAPLVRLSPSARERLRLV
jgi:hypothetical protein